MRKDNLIDKPTVVSLLGAAVSAALMVAFAIAYRIAGLFVPDTNAVMVAVHGIISLCGNILRKCGKNSPSFMWGMNCHFTVCY